MRLQLIMSLAADVLHKSSPLHPGCFHGDGASNCGAPALSPAVPAKVDAGAGSPSALPLGERRALGQDERAGRGSPREGESLFYSSAPCDGRMRGQRRSSSEIRSPELLNQRAGVSLPREWAAIGCRRPPVPMGARRAPGAS